jgi:hypothetical protein
MLKTDIVAHSPDQARAVAEFYKLPEFSEDPAIRRDNLAGLEGADFVGLIQKVNNVIRGGEANASQPFDGINVALMFQELPDHADKEQLLKETWDTAREFLKNPDMNDEDALAYAGLTAAGGLVYVHPFADSNGRTGRVLMHLMTGSRSESLQPELEEILSAAGRKAFGVSPVDMQHYANREQDHLGATVQLPPKVTWGDENTVLDGPPGQEPDPAERLAGSTVKRRALKVFLEHSDEAARELFGKYTQTAENGQAVSLDAESALKELVNLPEKGIGYAAQLAEAHRIAKAEFVRKFLKAMTNDNHQDFTDAYQRKLVERARAQDPELGGINAVHAINLAKLATGAGQIKARDDYLATHQTYSSIKRDQNSV